MNSKTHALLQQLELATSREPADETVWDDETVMLREQWQLFGRLLAEGNGVDSQAEEPGRTIVSSIHQWSTTVDLPPRPVPSRRVRRWWTLAALPAVAVLCLWLTVGGMMPGSGVRFPRGMTSTQPLTTERSPSTASSNDVPELRTGSWEVAWEDDWDANLARTSLAVQRIRSPLTRDASWTRLQDTMQELAREVESGSL